MVELYSISMDCFTRDFPRALGHLNLYNGPLGAGSAPRWYDSWQLTWTLSALFPLV